MSENCNEIKKFSVESHHPCYGNDAHKKFRRIHLPVAPKCNIKCGYCDRKFDCVNESRPGITSRIMNPLEALNYVKINDNTKNNLKVIGVAGPGEPLFNEETFKTLAIARYIYPEMIKCISTNGVELENASKKLRDFDVDSVTVTLNTLNPKSIPKIYDSIGNSLDIKLESDCNDFINKQIRGIKSAISLGMKVKINTVLIPNVNEDEIEEIAKYASELGVYIFNIMPLIPQGRFKNTIPPSKKLIEELKMKSRKHIKILWHCNQCRADAVGIPNKI
jgi:nitrogen fixation protein NifB